MKKYILFAVNRFQRLQYSHFFYYLVKFLVITLQSVELISSSESRLINLYFALISSKILTRIFRTDRQQDEITESQDSSFFTYLHWIIYTFANNSEYFPKSHSSLQKALLKLSLDDQDQNKALQNMMPVEKKRKYPHVTNVELKHLCVSSISI